MFCFVFSSTRSTVKKDECHADDMEAMLSRWFFVEDIELEQLRNYGWRHSGEVIYLWDNIKNV